MIPASEPSLPDENDMQFKISSEYKPSGDQPGAIDGLCSAINEGADAVTLLGVTGSGKTFTMANVIERLQRPALILSHNKTLAAQLYGEFKSFFPNNAVEYFVSYYDYYQPEAYIPSTDTYIEKDLSINEQIDKLRLSAASALMSGRRDVIVVSSVSCLYGIGNPQDFHSQTVELHVGQQISETRLLYHLVDALFSRTETDLKRGTFRVRGDTVDVYLGGSDEAVRIEFFGDEIDSLSLIEPVTGATIEQLSEVPIYPAGNFVTTKEKTVKAVSMIQDDLVKQMEYFESIGKNLEAKRLKQRVEYDLEMMKEMGYCPGIENYSRYLDGRKAGQRPFCLIDYFQDDFITFIDESHVTIPQIRAMYGGDHSRKSVLIDYGFRLPAAMDNRPLTFEEFQQMAKPVIYVSATPAEYELQQSEGIVVEQVIQLTEYEMTGIELDCKVSSQVLINIFEHNTPLHDGAVIIRGDRITSATCYLPLSDNMTISKDLGTRHRAALGMSEVCDALVIVVSEETGLVSVASGGRLLRAINAEELRSQLSQIQYRKTETKNKFSIRKGWHRS